MSEVLQYRFPEVPGEGAQGLAGHALGNLLIAAMTAVEGGDFEDGVRLMNRILAVRGQVLPVSATPLTLHARLADGSVVDGQSQIMRTAGIDRVWLTPDRRPGVRGRPGGDRRGRAHRPRPRQPLHEPPAQPADPRHPRCRPGRRGACASTSATSRRRTGETTGFDLAAHVEALVAHTAPQLVDVVLANNHFAAQTPPDWTAEPVRLRWPPARARRAAARPRRRRRPGQCPSSRSGPPGRRTDSDARGGPRDPPPGGRAGAPDVSRSERDLVTALRDELAAIDPSRPCDRIAEVAGLGPGPVGREPSVARLAVRLRRRAPERSRRAGVRLGRGRRSLPGGLAARPVPGPRLAQPGRRPDPPRVRRPAR